MGLILTFVVDQPYMVYMIKESSDVCFYHIVCLSLLFYFYDFSDCLMTVPVWTEPKALMIKLWLINLFQYLCDCILHRFVLMAGDLQWPHFAFCLFGDIDPSCGVWTVTAGLHSFYKIFLQILFILLFRHSVNSTYPPKGMTENLFGT